MKIINTKKIYKFYNDNEPDYETGRIIIEEDGFTRTGHIEIIDEEKAPFLLVFATGRKNDITCADAVLEERVLPINRNLLIERCEAKGKPYKTVDDRLRFCNGRRTDDDFFVKVEVYRDNVLVEEF